MSDKPEVKDAERVAVQASQGFPQTGEYWITSEWNKKKCRWEYYDYHFDEDDAQDSVDLCCRIDGRFPNEFSIHRLTCGGTGDPE